MSLEDERRNTFCFCTLVLLKMQLLQPEAILLFLLFGFFFFSLVSLCFIHIIFSIQLLLTGSWRQDKADYSARKCS